MMSWLPRHGAFHQGTSIKGGQFRDLEKKTAPNSIISSGERQSASSQLVRRNPVSESVDSIGESLCCWPVAAEGLGKLLIGAAVVGLVRKWGNSLRPNRKQTLVYFYLARYYNSGCIVWCGVEEEGMNWREIIIIYIFFRNVCVLYVSLQSKSPQNPQLKWILRRVDFIFYSNSQFTFSLASLSTLVATSLRTRYTSIRFFISLIYFSIQTPFSLLSDTKRTYVSLIMASRLQTPSPFPPSFPLFPPLPPFLSLDYPNPHLTPSQTLRVFVLCHSAI